jgi:hypothetical protein
MTEGKKIEVDPGLMKILARNPEGFNERYEELLPKFRYYHQAYEAVEAEYEGIMKQRRYDSWENFRQVRSRLLKAKASRR